MDKDTIKRVGSNAQAVMEEAGEMLESLAAIKGSDYATLTRMMLMSMTAGNTMRLALLGKEEPLVDALTAAFSSQMANLLACAADLACVPNAVLKEAFEDAKRLDETVNSLMNRAISSAVDGKDFG